MCLFWDTVGKLFTTATPPNGLAIIAPNDHFAGTAEDMHHVAKSVNSTTATILSTTFCTSTCQMSTLRTKAVFDQFFRVIHADCSAVMSLAWTAVG